MPSGVYARKQGRAGKPGKLSASAKGWKQSAPAPVLVPLGVETCSDENVPFLEGNDDGDDDKADGDEAEAPEEKEDSEGEDDAGEEAETEAVAPGVSQEALTPPSPPDDPKEDQAALLRHPGKAKKPKNAPGKSHKAKIQTTSGLSQFNHATSRRRLQ